MADSDKPPVRRSREQTAAAKPGSKRNPRLDAPTIGGDDGPASGPFELGAVLGARYRILELLGEGGMGAVYRARDLTLGADVALKVLDPAMSQSPERVDYFRNEILLARRVTHENVCRLHDIASEGDNWFITMEYIRGESLADYLRRESPTTRGAADLERAERIIREVASGLAAAHRAGVVHRDLKPDNIMLADDGGRAVIADFGIAVEVNQLGSASVDRAGTRGYMSPEQAAGKDIDARTDVFALGVLAHRMVTGELPWIAPTRVTSTDIEAAPAAITTDVPGPLALIIERCLSPAPEDRPDDAAAVLALLDGSSRPRPRRRLLWAAALALVALAGGGAALSVALGSGSGPLVFRAPRVVVESVDVSGLDPSMRWLEHAFARRLVNELDDAWGVSARMWTDAGKPPGIGDIRLAAALTRDDAGKLAVTVDIMHPGGRSRRELATETFQGLVVEAAASTAEDGIPEPLRRPTAEDLALVGGHDREAWRWFRRSQRASLRQEWSRARDYSKRALDLDPSFVAGNLELSWTFDSQDTGRLAALDAAVAQAELEPGLGFGWRSAIDFARADRVGDASAMGRAIAAVLDSNLSFRQRWYFNMRIFARMWFDGPRSRAVAKLEWHVETFSRLSGPAKLLANHYMGLDGQEAAAQALRFARIAVANGPDDVAARAELGRAEARAGNREAALEQLAIIEHADADEKRYAVAGGESTNSLFDLHIALGDFTGAARAARRLYNGSLQQQGHAADALARLALFRGDISGGRRLLEEAIDRFKQSGTSDFSVNAEKKRVWTAFALGDYAAVIDTLETLPTGRWSAHYDLLKRISLHRLAGSPRRSEHLAGADAVVATLREGTRYRAFLALLLAIERRDWRAALAQQDLAARGREYIAGYLFLARAAEETGDLERAASWCETLADHRHAWSEPVHSTEARLAAARLREKLGQKTRAIEHYRAYVSRLDLAPPSHRGVRTAKRRLRALGALDNSQ